MMGDKQYQLQLIPLGPDSPSLTIPASHSVKYTTGIASLPRLGLVGAFFFV